jgi:DNA polymerase-3 subunit delta'
MPGIEPVGAWAGVNESATRAMPARSGLLDCRVAALGQNSRAMAFREFPQYQKGIQLLQRSLERGRLAHGYLFTGDVLEELEGLAANLAKTLICQNPSRKGSTAIDCCDECLACNKVTHLNHADVHWVRPESKSRVIRAEQMRDLMQEINLKPTEAAFKVCIIVAADRMNESSANAFLKTLEEPPANSVIILLSTEPQRILETILSRCLRLTFAGDGRPALPQDQLELLKNFSDLAASGQKSLIGRYRLMDVLLKTLNAMRDVTETNLTARSPLQRYDDIEADLREKWEDELKAAIEAEYRRQRSDLLRVLQLWLRDVWLRALDGGRDAGAIAPLLNFPELAGTAKVASRISAGDAVDNLQVMEQLQRWLKTNVQEALALEVGLLKLHL